MKTILIVGHRCSGKTSIVDALKNEGYTTFDLDREIESSQKLSPSQIIADNESRFREIETKTLARLCEHKDPTPRIISVGAGCLEFPHNAAVIWVYRDAWSHVAKNERDRLKPEMSFEEEVAWMRAIREPVWKRRAHLKIDIPDGRRFDRVVEKVAESIALLIRVAESDFAKTTWIVAPQQDIERAMIDVDLFGLAGIECRSDLVQHVPERENMIASLRHPDPDWLSARVSAKIFDIDIEYLPSVLDSQVLNDLDPRTLILSCHPDRVDPIDVERLIKAGRAVSESNPLWTDLVFKYAPKVETFDQLGFARALILPIQNAGLSLTFLPQGQRFRFFRILNLHTNTTNYIPSRLNCCHQSHIAALDLQDWLDHIDTNPQTKYRALIGDPVDGSQGSFWHNRENREENENTSYLKVPMSNDEVESGLAQLLSLGIDELSVTSPLKKHFALNGHQGIPKSYGIQILETPDTDIRFANTLKYVNRKWTGIDTDYIGMLSALEELKGRGIDKGTIALFGRGDVSRAVLAAIKESDWQVVYHTGARDGWVEELTSSENNTELPASVNLIVNMSGSAAFDGACKCDAWIDLHYNNTQIHPAAIYFTGDTFFEAQAKAQRKFWST